MPAVKGSVSPSLLDTYLHEVTERITTLAGRTTPFRIDESGMGRLRSIRVPAQRRALKAGYSFSGIPPAELIYVRNHIWHSSDLMGVMSQALYAYQHKKLQKQEFSRIRSWINRCACWEHSDDLSKIYASVVEHNPTWIRRSLVRWNAAKSPWKKRQSVVALIEYASKRERFLPYAFMISQFESLLDDQDYCVQKGVGWTIREIGHAYPAEVAHFLEKNPARLSLQAWTGTPKTLPQERKAVLKVLRLG